MDIAIAKKSAIIPIMTHSNTKLSEDKLLKSPFTLYHLINS